MTPSGAGRTIADQGGLTLVEVLVAVAVIAVGLAGVVAVVPGSLRAVHEGGQLSTATFLAEQLIERARAAAWRSDPPADCLGVSSGDAAPQPSEGACQSPARLADEPQVRDHPGYQRLVRVAECDTAGGCGGVAGTEMRRVTVTVRYTPLPVSGAPASVPRSIQLEWLATRR